LPAIGPLKWKRYGFSFGKLERSGIGGGSYDDDEYVFIFWNFKRSKALNLFILAKYEVVQARGDSSLALVLSLNFVIKHWRAIFLFPFLLIKSPFSS
jgi:hypothetical protein